MKYLHFISGVEKWWEVKERTETPKKVKEHESTGDKWNEECDIDKLKKDLKLYGKAFSTAQERELFTKIPSLLLKMGTCHKQIAIAESDIVHKLRHTRIASRNIGTAIESTIINKSCSQSEEWVQKAAQEAQGVGDFYLDTLVPKVSSESDKHGRIATSMAFANELLHLDLPRHPYLSVRTGVFKQVSFMAYDLVTESLQKEDHQRAKHYLQIMKSAFEKASDACALQDDDPEVTNDLKILAEDYLNSSDIAQALESLEAGGLIASLAQQDIDAEEVESALDHAWNAIDKFSEAERLTADTMDNISFNAESVRGLLFLNIFKNLTRTKKIFLAIIESSASENYKDKDWFQEVEAGLQKIESQDPAFQKAQILEELKPDLEKIRVGTKRAPSNLQEAVDFIFSNYPPPRLADGSQRAVPSVTKLGVAKAVRKMIVSYHPDKIDKADPKKKILYEEITKVFSDMC